MLLNVTLYRLLLRCNCKTMAKKEKTPVKSTAGRKPIADKKVRVILYIKESTIKANGGFEELKAKLYEAAGEPQ